MRLRGTMARALGQIPFWKLRESLKLMFAQVWRVRVLFERLYGIFLEGLAKLQLWRVSLWLKRLSAQTWRLRVWKQRIQIEWSKIIGLSRQLIGWAYGRGLEARTVWTTALRPRLVSILRKASYPVRKVYYFANYQIKTRLSSKRKEPS